MRSKTDIIVEIEAVERAIEDAYFVVEVEDLKARLDKLNQELREWDTTHDKCRANRVR